MVSGIYKITNMINQKMYVGSAVNLNNRISSHLCKLRKNLHGNNHLQASYNKYGEIYFQFEILELVEDKNNLLKKEQYWIDKLDTFNYGYNQLPNAGSTLGYKLSDKRKEEIRKSMLGNTHALGRKATIEEKKKHSEILKKRFNTDEYKKLLSKRMKGNTNTLGFKHSDDTKLKMSLARKGIPKPEGSKENYQKAALLREAKKREGAPKYIKPIWLNAWDKNNEE